jgi:hypothetical protein
LTDWRFTLVMPNEVRALIERAQRGGSGWGQQTRLEISPQLPVIGLGTFDVLYNQELRPWGLLVVRGKGSGRIQAYIYPALKRTDDQAFPQEPPAAETAEGAPYLSDHE